MGVETAKKYLEIYKARGNLDQAAKLERYLASKGALVEETQEEPPKKKSK